MDRRALFAFVVTAVITTATFVTGPLIRAACAQDGAATMSETEALEPQTHRSVLTLKVADFNEASRRILVAARDKGGELIDAHTAVAPTGRRNGWVRLSVPADRLPAFLADARAAGILYAEKVATQDNATEYGSLGRRVERLRQHETRLSGVLSSERRLRGSDILYVQERLFRASVDESLLAQEQSDLARHARVSRVTVFLFEPVTVRASDQAHRTLSAQFAFGRGRAVGIVAASTRRAATAAAYAWVFAPLWTPLLLAAVLLAAWVWRRWGREAQALFILVIASARALLAPLLLRAIAALRRAAQRETSLPILPESDRI